MYQITFFTPDSHCELVKNAMFDAGAGRYEHYEHCSWQILGEGQFKPLKGSKPFLGRQNDLETVAEYRVEMICEQACLSQVIRAMRDAHPYEQPAYFISRHTQISL